MAMSYDEVYLQWVSGRVERIVGAGRAEETTREIHVSLEAYPYKDGTAEFPGTIVDWDWDMFLQRWDPYNRQWVTIGTRDGYVATNSPSYRTFTNISRTPFELRVKVRFDRGASYGDNRYAYMYLDELYIK